MESFILYAILLSQSTSHTGAHLMQPSSEAYEAPSRIIVCIVHMSVLVHTTAPCSTCSFGVCLRCLPVLSWMNLSACGCLLAPLSGITSYYTGIPLPALHSLQQLQAGTSSPFPVQMSASTRESHNAAPSSSVSCPQVTLSATHPQGQMDTRTITNDLLSATLAEAATQLSFAAYLERCIFVSASPPPQLPVPTPPLDAATQTLPHTTASRDVSTQFSFSEFLASPSTHDVFCPTCARPVHSLLLDAAVQTPLHSVATHDASTQLPLTEFFIGCILSNDPLDRQAFPSVHCNAGNASLSTS